MSHYICQTCGTQFGESATVSAHCPICEDERQYIGWGGQQLNDTSVHCCPNPCNAQWSAMYPCPCGFMAHIVSTPNVKEK